MVLDMITRFRREGEADVGTGGPDSAGTGTAPPEPEIDTLILLDRGVDVITPLMTPLTFEALVDQVFHIDSGTYRCCYVLVLLVLMVCWKCSHDSDSQGNAGQRRSTVACAIQGSNRQWRQT